MQRNFTMFDTYVTVVGNVLHEPEQRQTTTTGAVVTTFKIASTARRMDRQSGKWTDGNSLRVRVTCWRSLASNVRQSVRVGDPLVVHGRLFTRDWEDENGNRRLAYELEAIAVGHDLSRGRAVFERARPRTGTSTIEDADVEQRVGGEPTGPVSEDEQVPFDDTPFEAVFDQPGAVPAGRGEQLSPIGDDSGPADPGPDPEPAEEVGGRRRRSKVNA
jgi:single-strand DNA-binding protein